MTPNNIFNMANLKGLDILAVTDHNSLKQLNICQELSMSYDMLFIPGVEISLHEGFHVLCYFKTMHDAQYFDQVLENYIEKQSYDLQLYGEQQIVDINDEVIATYPYHLSSALSLDLPTLKKELSGIDYLLFYAHLDRPSYSGINYIKNNPLDGLELTQNATEQFINQHELYQHKTIYNSDAHQIIDIQEKSNKNHLELDELSIDAFFRYFNHG